MNITGFHVGISVRKGATSPLADASGRQVPDATGVVDQTDYLLPNIMDLSENILLAHYQRERR
jgi:hypothetical protein